MPPPSDIFILFRYFAYYEVYTTKSECF